MDIYTVHIYKIDPKTGMTLDHIWSDRLKATNNLDALTKASESLDRMEKASYASQNQHIGGSN